MSGYKTEVSGLHEKNKLIEAELSEVRAEHEHRMEAVELKLQEEKRKEIGKLWVLPALKLQEEKRKEIGKLCVDACRHLG